MAAIFISPSLAPDHGGRPMAQVYLIRRLVVAALAVATVLVVLQAFASISSGAPQPPRVGVAMVHIVQPGESLWSIARTERPGVDVSQLVDKMMRLNGGSTIQVGQLLALPE